MQKPARFSRWVRTCDPGCGEIHTVISSPDDDEICTWGSVHFSFLGSTEQFHREFKPCES